MLQSHPFLPSSIVCNLESIKPEEENKTDPEPLGGNIMSSSIIPTISATRAVPPSTSLLFPPSFRPRSSTSLPTSNGGLLIQCSSRPKKKATAHHMKTRPRKTQPWDIRRKPTVYAPLPPLPPDWTLVSDSAAEPVASGDRDAGLQAPAGSG